MEKNQMILLIKLPKEFKEHFAMDKFKDSFMRICGDVDEIQNRKTKFSHFPLPFLTGNYEKELVGALANSFENAVELDNLEPQKFTPEEIEKIKNSEFRMTQSIVSIEPRR